MQQRYKEGLVMVPEPSSEDKAQCFGYKCHPHDNKATRSRSATRSPSLDIPRRLSF